MSRASPGQAAPGRRLGVVAALPDEVRNLQRGLGGRPARRLPAPGQPLALACPQGGPGLLLVRSGMGAEAAAAAAWSLVAAGAGALLSWGTGGGLSPALAAGDVVLAEAVLDRDGRPLAVSEALHVSLREALGSALPAGLPLHRGRILEAAAVIASPAAKAAAHARSRALLVDMESAAVAAVATAAGLPFAALRVVVDGADMPLPQAALAAVDGYGRLRPAALAGRLARHPGEVAALIRLGRAHARACASLRCAAGALCRISAPPQSTGDDAAATPLAQASPGGS